MMSEQGNTIQGFIEECSDHSTVDNARKPLMMLTWLKI